MAGVMVSQGGGEAVVTALRAAHEAQLRGSVDAQHGVEILQSGAKLMVAW